MVCTSATTPSYQQTRMFIVSAFPHKLNILFLKLMALRPVC